MNKNNILYAVIAIVVVAVLVFAFSGRKSTEQTSEVTADPFASNKLAVKNLELNDGSYNVSEEESLIIWAGSKPLITNYVDKGTLLVKSGSFNIENGALTNGEININMDSLVATEVAKGGTEGLTRHLRSADFFDVENHPSATIVLLDVLPESQPEEGYYVFNAAITIKGITNNAEIAAEVYTGEDGRTFILGEASLDRTLWDVRFGSGKFFEDLADNLIDDYFAVEFIFVGIPS